MVLCAFPIDLTREDAKAFQMLAVRCDRAWNRHRRRGLLLLTVATLLIGWLLLQNTTHYVWLLIAAGCLLVEMLYLLVGAPALQRWRAGRTYDAAIQSGHGYAGTVRIYPDRIEKCAGDRVLTSVPLGGSTFFVEQRNMMVFFSTQETSILLPARYMTADTAEAARAAAQRLLPSQRRLFSLLQPQGLPVTGRPPAVPVVLWEQTFTYTPAEMVQASRRLVIDRFLQWLPFYVALCLLSALAISVLWTLVIPATLTKLWVAFTVLLLLVSTALMLLRPLLQQKKQTAMLSEEQRRVTVTMDTTAVRIGFFQKAPVVLWRALPSDVVVAEPFVCVTAGRKTVFRFPQRILTDLPAFADARDQYRKQIG